MVTKFLITAAALAATIGTAQAGQWTSQTYGFRNGDYVQDDRHPSV